MATLRTEALTKSYGGRTVVRGVSVEVRSGEVVDWPGPPPRLGYRRGGAVVIDDQALAEGLNADGFGGVMAAVDHVHPQVLRAVVVSVAGFTGEEGVDAGGDGPVARHSHRHCG